jgi:flagellar basal body-associated protein FliL
MKKTYIIITIAILAILVLAAIFFLIIHKPSLPTPQQEAQVSGVSDTEVNSIGQDVNAVNDSDFSDNSLDSLG